MNTTRDRGVEMLMGFRVLIRPELGLRWIEMRRCWSRCWNAEVFSGLSLVEGSRKRSDKIWASLRRVGVHVLHSNHDKERVGNDYRQHIVERNTTLST